jgi:cob(I)alamin adenosyltransferase
MKSKVTTKKGDGGRTVALSGQSLSKAHPIMECTGSLDELRCHTALVRLLILEHDVDGPGDASERARLADFLLWLLHVYFIIGAQVSDPLNRKPTYRVTNLSEEHLARLEKEQARLEGSLSLPKAFVVSATNAVAAQVDLVCTVARRFERSVVALQEAVPEFEGSLMLSFVNRLSDYLFVLARHIESGDHLAVDYGVLEKGD